MQPVISIHGLGKKYKIGLEHEDLLANKIVNSINGIFRKNSSTKDTNIFWALSNVSFDVLPGEVVGIIGRNGAGKSTLLKLISQITEPSRGKIILRGRVASLLEIGTGFHPELTGKENIYLNGSILGMYKSEIKKKFDEIVAFAEVEKFINTPVKRYSSGMLVRLGFSVAAHLEPEILLVDEVLAVGDAMFQNKCLGKMEEVSTQGRTILFVSHQLGTLGRLCKRAIHLDQGKIINSGESGEVIQNYLRGINLKESSETDFKKDLSKKMQFQKISILDSNDHSSQILDYKKPFKLEIIFQVYENVTNSYVLVVFSTLDDTVRIDITRSLDAFSVEMCTYEPGTYCTQVEFPGGVLNIGNYYARTALCKSKSMTGKEVFDKGKSLPFELIDIDQGKFQSLLTSEKKGFLNLDYKWTQNKL